MAGHVILLSCLLAICIPIIFVQLPRFDIVKEPHAENEAETRSSVLRRRPLSSARKVLRRSSGPWSEANIDTASVETEQGQGGPEQATQAAAGRQECTSAPRFIVQGNAWGDDRASSREEVETAERRADRKPWDPPFKRQLPTTEPIKKRFRKQSNAVTHATPRKTGRGLEASGVAVRLFPPNLDPERNQVYEYDRSSALSSSPLQSSLEPLHLRLARLSQPQTRESNRQASFQEYQPTHPRGRRVPPQCLDTESLPSPLDRPPLSSICRSPRDVSPAAAKAFWYCHHRHCRHTHTDASPPQLPSNATTAPNGAFQDVLSDVAKSPPKKAPEDSDKQARNEASRVVIRTHKASLGPWRALLVTMGLLIFIFAFAILVAHCLAWFLVYKTEARMGDVRRGLLRGGEMKLCLCGKN